MLSTIASLLGSRREELEKALCYRVVGNKLGAVEKMHTREQAEYGRDAFAKVRGEGEGEGGVIIQYEHPIMSTLNKRHNSKNLKGPFSIILVHFNLRREDNLSIKAPSLLY